MADDITLFIRARDLTRQTFSNVRRSLARLQNDLRRLSRRSLMFPNRFGRALNRLIGGPVNRLSRGLRGVDRGLGDLRRRILAVANTLDILSRSGVRGARAFRRMADAMMSLQRVIGAFQRVVQRAQQRIARFHRALRRGIVGARMLRRVYDGLGVALRDMRRALRQASGALGLMGRGIRAWGRSLLRGSDAAWILLAVLTLIGPAAQLLSVLLVTTLGAAFIALGAFALKGNAQVKAAFEDMKDGVTSSIKTAAQPLKPFLIDGMALLRSETERLQPAFEKAFAAAGPLVRPLVESLTHLVERALPGFTAAMQGSVPAMEGFRTALGAIGEGLGEMMRAIVVGNEETLRQVWINIGNGIKDLLITLGKFMAAMNESRTVTFLVIGVFKLLEGALKALEGMFAILDRTLTPVIESIATLSLDPIVEDMLGLSSATGKAALGVRNLDESTGQFKDKSDGIRLGMRDLRDAAQKTADAYRNQANEIKGVVGAMKALNDFTTGLIDKQAAFEQGFIDATEAVKENAGALKMQNGALDLTSQGAIDVWRGLRDLTQGTLEYAEQVRQANGSQEQINKVLKDGRDRFVELADKAGLTTEQAEKLATQLGLFPGKITTEFEGITEDLDGKMANSFGKIGKFPKKNKTEFTGNTADLLGKAVAAGSVLDELDRRTPTTDFLGDNSDLLDKARGVGGAINRVPKPKMSFFRGDNRDAVSKARGAGRAIGRVKGRRVTISARNRTAGAVGRALGQLARVRDKTVTIRAHYVESGAVGGVVGRRAHGGIVGAQGGGPRSAMTLVGEQGPELVRLPFGSTVIPAGQSRSMLQHGVVGSGGQGPSELVLRSSGSRVDDLLLEILRRAIDARGGDPNVVLRTKRRGAR